MLKLILAVAELPDDPPIIRVLKNKVRSSLELRTATEELASLACMLIPYTKDFVFMSDERAEAHELLRRLALGLNDIVVIKKEKKKNRRQTLILKTLPCQHPPLPAPSPASTS